MSLCNIHALTVATADWARPLCKRHGQSIVCTNDIWIERAFRLTDTDTMATISTFLGGEMIRPGSDLWNALFSPGNTRNLFATGSSNRYYPSYWKDISIDHKLDVTWHLQMAAPYLQHHRHHVLLRVRCFPCSLVLKVELVPPSLLRSSNVPSSFWSVFQCLSWQCISVHPLYGQYFLFLLISKIYYTKILSEYDDS